VELASELIAGALWLASMGVLGATMRIVDEPIAADARRPRRPATPAPVPADAWTLARTIGNRAFAACVAASRDAPLVRARSPLLQREVSYLTISTQSAVRYESRTAEGKTRYTVFYRKSFDDAAKREIEAQLPQPRSSVSGGSGPFAHTGVSLGSHPFAGLSLGPQHPFQAPKEQSSGDVGIDRDDVKYVLERSSYIDVEGWGIRYYHYDDGHCDVFLPSDFPEGKVSAAEMTIKAKHSGARLKFVNEQGDTVLNVVTADQRKRLVPKSLNRNDKQQQAMQFVEVYLAKHNLLGGFKGLLADQMTRITFDDDPSQWFMTAMTVAGEKDRDRAANTEGITSTKRDVGTRCVFMNASNFTVRAIVHELLHALSHLAMNSIGWIEGLTEYLTLQATGLTMRTDVKGSTIYSRDVAALRHAMNQTGVTENELVQAYFGGAMGRLAEISALMTT
jgi:hypothetical protein